MSLALRKHHHIIYEAEINKRYDHKRECIIKSVTYRCCCPDCNYKYIDRSFVNILEAKSKTSVLEKNKRKHIVR